MNAEPDLLVQTNDPDALDQLLNRFGAGLVGGGYGVVSGDTRKEDPAHA